MNMMIVWGVVAVAALLVEIVTVGAMTSIWFTVGAIASLILAALKVNTVIQIVAFVVVSLLALLTIRPMAAEYLRGNTVATNNDRLIGTFVKVTKEITPDVWGEVATPGMKWSAVEVNGEVCEVDTKVKVLAIEGAKLIVKK